MRRATVVLLLALVLPALAAPPARAWRGEGRAAGVVLDADGRPVEGARVTLTPPGDAGGGPDPVTTNAKGRWSVAGLAAGVWGIAIEAAGHATSHGRVAVRASGPARRVTVRLRPREEVAPLAGVENSPAFALPDRPVLAPAPHRTGSYRTAFAEAGEISSLATFVERSGIDPGAIRAEDPAAGTRALADETFEVYVPAGYRPDVPHGLFVWVSPTPYGGVGRDETRAVLDRLRIISIGANRSGNERPRWDRYALALEAARHARKLYAIDERRVWIGGYSGGGRVASGLAMLYPDVFRGGFYFFGCDHYLDMPVTDRPGARWPAMFRKPPRESLRELKRQHRFVLLTGELDFNRLQTRATYESLRDEGFRHVTYLELPGAGHYTGVDAAWLERGFAALDGTAPD